MRKEEQFPFLIGRLRTAFQPHAPDSPCGFHSS